MLNMLSLFSGIGAFEKALENLGIPYNLVGYCEIDKYASKAYSIIHGVPEEKNLKDVTKVDWLDIDETVDLITYGFPCQDISNAGKQKGFTDEGGNRTRSGLFFEALRIIEDFKPKFAIAENVKALTSKKFANEFRLVLESLDAAGYNNYYAVLNSKDFGIPQNRERVFIISIRKDIDKGFTFPEAIPLELKLKDLLEDEVDEKYYLSEKMFNYAFNMVKEAKGIGFSDNVNNSRINPIVANTIGCRSATDQRSGTTNYVSELLPDDYSVGELKKDLAVVVSSDEDEIVVKQVGQLYGTEKEPNPKAGRIYDAEGLSPTLLTCSGGNSMPIVATDETDDIDEFLNS